MNFLLSLLPLAISTVAQHQTPLGPELQHLDTIPLLGFGTWNLDKSNASEAVSWAIQTGYRHIDCAAAYGNEVEVGRGIADGLAKSGLQREELWVTSKLWNDAHDDVQAGIEHTLRDLGLEYLDLYLMHWPVQENATGKSIEYIETWKSMIPLISQNLTHNIGVANFSPAQLKALSSSTHHLPSVHQMELHPYLQQKDWLAFHQKHNIHVTAYSPLAGTNPTYASPKNPEAILDHPTIRHIARKRRCTPAQVVLKWAFERGTSVIPKSQQKARITENFEMLECELTEKDVRGVDALGSEHYRFNNPSQAWGVGLFDGLEDSRGRHRLHS